jgi:hypothetical protein
MTAVYGGHSPPVIFHAPLMHETSWTQQLPYVHLRPLGLHARPSDGISPGHPSGRTSGGVAVHCHELGIAARSSSEIMAPEHGIEAPQ